MQSSGTEGTDTWFVHAQWSFFFTWLVQKCSYNTCRNLELTRVLSHTKLRELVIKASRGILPDISFSGTHSLRSGRLMAAFNASVPVRLCFASRPLFYSFRQRCLCSKGSLISLVRHLVFQFVWWCFCSSRSCPGYHLIWGTAGPGFSSWKQVDVQRGFSPSCCSTTPYQLALASYNACKFVFVDFALRSIFSFSVIHERTK